MWTPFRTAMTKPHETPRVVNDAAMTGASPPWHAQLCQLLVTGATLDQAVHLLRAEGAQDDTVRAAAADYMAGPMFGIARAAWGRLAAREWLLGIQADLADLRGELGQIPTAVTLSREEFIGQYYLTNRAVL